MRELTRELVREIFDYREDGVLIWKARRGSIRVGAIAGCALPSGYRAVRLFRRNHLQHRIIFLWHHGWLPKPPYQIDHINMIRSDNRIENLRYFDTEEAAHQAFKKEWEARLVRIAT